MYLKTYQLSLNSGNYTNLSIEKFNPNHRSLVVNKDFSASHYTHADIESPLN